MLKNIVISILLFVLIYFMYVFNSKFERNSENHYLKAQIDKSYLIKNINPKRIIIIGGSNVAFGINSEMIENKTRLNVINMGLHGGLGYEYIIKSAIKYFKKDDIIIVIPEYELFYSDNQINKEALMMFDFYPNSFSEYNYFKRLKISLFSNVNKMQTNLRQRYNNYEIYPVDSIYRRNGFNSHGDLVGYYNLKTDKENYSKVCDTSYSDEFEEYTNLLIEKANVIGAKVFFSFPCIAKNASCVEAMNFYESKVNNIKGLRILGKPQDFVFDDSLFFYSYYHMNKIGKELRSEKLIKLIKKELSIN